MILVTGCARSGTSLVTGVLQACGMSLGTGKINGLNEHVGVRDDLVKPYLRSIGADPLGQHPLPSLDDVRIEDGWRLRVWQKLGFPNEPWGYKGAKLCLIWPLWKHAFPDATWVIVRRDTDKIAESCLRTQFMRAYHNVEGWRAWVEHHLARFEEMQAEMDCIEVWPNEAVKDIEGFRPMVEHCGLTWRPDEVAKVVNPGRWHG